MTAHMSNQPTTSTSAAPCYRPVGDCGLNVEFAAEISPQVNRRVQGLLAALDREHLPGLRDLVPAYRTLLVVYDPLLLPYEALLERLRGLERAVEETMPPPRTVTIPVAYDGELGPDLADVAEHSGMTEADVIARHAGGQYLVYFLGFSPGFPYLGGLDPALSTPRLPAPRQRVPAGAVGIAGSQTGIYPQSTPGGWRLIGRTPVRLYDPVAEEPCLLRPGDDLRFRAVDAREFARLSEAVAAGHYRPEIVAADARRADDGG